MYIRMYLLMLKCFQVHFRFKKTCFPLLRHEDHIDVKVINSSSHIELTIHDLDLLYSHTWNCCTFKSSPKKGGFFMVMNPMVEKSPKKTNQGYKQKLIVTPRCAPLRAAHSGFCM